RGAALAQPGPRGDAGDPGTWTPKLAGHGTAGGAPGVGGGAGCEPDRWRRAVRAQGAHRQQITGYVAQDGDDPLDQIGLLPGGAGSKRMRADLAGAALDDGI